MLASLHSILQEVNNTRHLDQLLSQTVQRINKTMSSDACSIYLRDVASECYILEAAVGFVDAPVGKASIKKDDGLVGLVCRREEPVNLDNLFQHPSYHHIAGLNDEHLPGFLGVPIIHFRKVLGVLVVRQHWNRCFDEDEVAFLQTIAIQLASSIAHAKMVSSEPVSGQTKSQSRAIVGIPGSPGVAVGVAFVVYPAADLDAVPDRQVTDVEAEVVVFQKALSEVRADIKRIMVRMSSVLAPEDRALFDAYLLMLDSGGLIDRTVERIQKGSWAAGALRDTVNEHARFFEEIEDPYLRERADDIYDLGRRILLCLQRGKRKPLVYPEHTILVGEEVSAAALAEVPAERLAGVISANGSRSSHVAILAHALGIPAVVGATNLSVGKMDKKDVIVDGYRGWFYLSPSAAMRSEYRRLADEEQELAIELDRLSDKVAETLDGIHVKLMVNTGLSSDISSSLACGAEGVGLYRTEFPFMARERFPGEDEQRLIYRVVLDTFSPRPVTLRTLDIGGDKNLSYFPIKEENPFLGWRGIRITLDQPEIFRTQIRAKLRASIGLKNLRILLPMVSHVSEVDVALDIINSVYDELIKEGESIQKPKIGVMIEVPSAVYQAAELARRVDFISIGTNDLTQYLLAVDRNNPRVAQLYDSLHPSLLKALQQIVESIAPLGKPVGICGEIAGDPAAAILWIAMGVDNLSMSAFALSRVKQVIRHFTVPQAQKVLTEVLQCEDAGAIRKILSQAIEEVGLGSLVRAGK